MIESLALTTARDRVGIPTSFANPLDAVTVAVLPAGAVARIHFGHGDPGRVVNQEGQTFEPDPSEASNGLFFSNDLGAGTVVLDISFVTYREPQPVVLVGRAPRAAPGGAWVNQLLRNFGLK